MKITPQFCPVDMDPFDTVEWDLRTAAIKGEGGEVLFEQTDCEVPESWSQLATNVVVSKYFYGEVGTPEREPSVRQLIHRVSRTIADWGIAGRLFRHARRRRAFLSRPVLALPASVRLVQFAGLVQRRPVPPVRHQGRACATGTGTPKQGKVDQPENPYEYPQGSACFIQSVEDNMEDIMELARSEAMLFKFGSGTGTDLSTLRSHREKLSGGGKPSGPLSFMRVYDQIAAVVKSGGKTRRAAKMQSIKDWHPDVMEFIECKAKEEKKARMLIEKGGTTPTSTARPTVRSCSRTPTSRSASSDEFMQRPSTTSKWTTHWVTDPKNAGPELRRQVRAAANGRRRLGLRRSGRAVRHDDQSLAHLPELGADQRLESLLGVHVPRRHGLQPGQHQPDEVPRGGRHVRRRAVPGGLPAVLHRPGNPGRPRQLSDAGGSPRTAIASGRWAWATRTWAA